MKTTLKLLVAGFTLLCLNPHLQAQGTAFTYQGRLTDRANPANGSYDLRFTLYDAPSDGNVIGSLTNTATGVSNGLFTAALDFGGVFNGSNYWLEIAARTNGGGAFTTLNPRQALAPAPYSVYAANAGSAAALTGLLPGGSLSGLYLSAVTLNNPANNLSGAFSGNGAGLTNLSVAAANVTGAFTLLQLPGAVLTNTESGVALSGTFAGDGSRLTNLSAGNITGGTIADAWLSANVPLLDGTNLFTGTNTFAGPAVLTNANNLFGGSFTGNGAGLTNLNASQLTVGTVANAQLANSTVTINAGSGLAGGGTVPLGGATTLTNAGVLSVTGNADITASTVNGAVTLGDTATSANTPSTIVKRDSFGSFSAGNVILSRNLNLPATTATVGAISLGGSLFMHAYGSGNLFAGANAGNLTMTGGDNTGVGNGALEYNTSGQANTANGYQALWADTSGFNNTASGCGALGSNTTGGANTASGMQALFNNASGINNTADGKDALRANTTGSQNTANGFQALYNNTAGFNNTASGYQALLNTVGSSNIAVGYQAGQNLTTGSSNIDIGNFGVAGETNTIRIGSGQTQTFIAAISGATAAGGIVVYVNPSGQLGTLNSSARFKQDIRSMDQASDVLLSLRPVTFRYKPELDPQGLPQFGLIAEEVDQVDPALVARDDQHQIYTVRYEAVNAMLLNEFLKQHRKVEAQNAEIEVLKAKAAKVDALEKKLDDLQALVKQLAARQ